MGSRLPLAAVAAVLGLACGRLGYESTAESSDAAARGGEAGPGSTLPSEVDPLWAEPASQGRAGWGRAPSPGRAGANRAWAGRAAARRRLARAARRRAAPAGRRYDFVPEHERANAALIRKTIATDAVERCLRKAVEASGGAAFFRKSPIERLFRDAQAMQFHPLPAIRQVFLTGRLAMGLPPAI